MFLLPVLLLALSVLALPQRDILSLIAGDSNTSSPSHTLLHTLKPTRSSQSPSVGPTTTQSSVEQWTPTPSMPTDSAGPATTKTVVASPSSFLPASTESRTTDDSTKAWEIVGIVITAVLFIAASVTFALFFDRLWKFLKDVICCTSRPVVTEEFIPDCEKRSCHAGTRPLSLSDWYYSNTETLHDAPTQPRELPWNAQNWNTLHRHPSRRKDHLPPA